MRLVSAGVATVLLGVWALALHSQSAETEAVVAFDGCARISVGPICHFKEGKSSLRLWMPGEIDKGFEVRIDRTLVAAKSQSVAGGLRIEVPKISAGTLSLSFRQGGQRRRWQLTLQRVEPDPVFEAAKEAAKAGDAKSLQQFLAEATGRAKVEALIEMARVTHREGRAAQAVVYQAEAAALAADEGEWSLESQARFARAFTLAFNLFQLDEAHLELDRAEMLEGRVSDVKAYAPYYRALLHSTASDLTSALADLRAAGGHAEVLGLEHLAFMVEERRASAERGIGYFHSALARYRQLLEWGRNKWPCDEARAATNLGWTLLLQREHQLARTNEAQASDPSIEAPEIPLRHALKLYRENCTSEEDGPAIVQLNLAFAALQLRDADTAEHWLNQVEAKNLSGLDRPWIDETKARIALVRGDFQAAKRWTDAQLALSQHMAGTDNRYRAQVLGAEVLTRLGQSTEALSLRQQAEATLDRLAMSVPLVGARHSFLTIRDDNVLGLAELWLKQNKPGQALKAVRRARSRSLGWARVSQGLARLSADQRVIWNALLGQYRGLRNALDKEVENDWTRSKSELEKVRSNRAAREARLAEILAKALSLLPVVPKEPPTEPNILRLGWVRLGTQVVIIGQIGADAFAEPWDEKSGSLPTAVGSRLALADRVLLHPYGDLRTRDLHMLAWKGRPLAAQVDTAYALDLSSGATPSPASSFALVVVDPAAELLRGDAEKSLVVGALEGAGVSVTTVDGEVADVRAHLGSTDWFHFGGHGSWSPTDPMAGGLALADGAQLGLGDILAASQVPSTVILTSCEAGRGAGEGGESFGLAHAFLVAGARVVVAPNREVNDEEAFRFARAFYGATGSAYERYRSAVSTLGVHASPFRVFSP